MLDAHVAHAVASLRALTQPKSLRRQGFTQLLARRFAPGKTIAHGSGVCGVLGAGRRGRDGGRRRANQKRRLP